MSYQSRFQSEDVDELFDAILSLKTREECYRFFEDICTINEIHAITQRLQVAKLLSENKTYNEIEAMTNASTATISRINKCLLYGADGYKIALDRLCGDDAESSEDGRSGGDK
ncbi:MAG: YerC/YecD family TrpR-related protein [Anaerovoracaceae bacterium]